GGNGLELLLLGLEFFPEDREIGLELLAHLLLHGRALREVLLVDLLRLFGLLARLLCLLDVAIGLLEALFRLPHFVAQAFLAGGIPRRLILDRLAAQPLHFRLRRRARVL